jgi:hypothetical protein
MIAQRSGELATETRRGGHARRKCVSSRCFPLLAGSLLLYTAARPAAEGMLPIGEQTGQG